MAMATQIVTQAGETTGWNIAQDRNSSGEVTTTVTLKLHTTEVELVTEDGRVIASASRGDVR